MGRTELQPLPKSDVRGVSFSIYRGRYRMRIRKAGHKTYSWTHLSTHFRLVLRDFTELAARYERGTFDPWAARPEGLTIEEAARRYLTDLQEGRGANHAKLAGHVLSQFMDTIDRAAPLEALTRQQLQRYYAARHRAASTRRTYFNYLRAWLRWCAKEGYLDRQPLEGERPPRAQKSRPKYFTTEEYQRFEEAAWSLALEHKTKPLHGAAARSLYADLPRLFRVAVESGLRQAELLHIRWRDVDFERATLTTEPYAYRVAGGQRQFETKNGKARTVPMSPGARRVLRAMHEARTNEDDDALVFPGTGGAPRDAGNLQRQVRLVRERAGLAKSFNFHSLRHTYASWLASGGVALQVLQRWMGHKSITTTQVYAYLLPEYAVWIHSPLHEALDEVKDQESLSPK